MAEQKIINGVDVPALGKVIHECRHDPELAAFRFRCSTEWMKDAGHSRTTITEFYGMKQENDGRRHRLEADEPDILLGKDQGPNPVEHLINALGSCMMGAMAYHAAARGIRLEECRCELEGEIDLRGFLGISEEVRRGYRNIRATFHVKGDGAPKDLEECARFSPVLDVVMHGTNVDLRVQKVEEASRRAPAESEARPSM